MSITRSERVNIELKLTLQAADEYTNNSGNPVIRKPRGLYIKVFHYTDQLTIEYHNSDCQLNEPITSQVRVTSAERGKMGVSLDRGSDWWRKWRDIFGGQSHSVAMQLKQSRLYFKLNRESLSERYLNTLKCGDSASFSGKSGHEMSELSIYFSTFCILNTFADE